MKRKIIPVLIGCALSFSGLAAQPTAERYVVSFPEGAHVKYSGAFASAFPNGLPVGMGSGLLFTGKQGDALTFATVTDRGPNADSPKMGKNDAKIFVTPDFAPQLMTIRVLNGKAEAVDARPLHDDKGEINGLPLQSGVIGSTNEVALSDTLKVLKGDNRGLDTEGITPDGKGGYWLCDEYGPFLINIDGKGKILAIHGPQATEGEKSIAGGLPNVIKWRQANRGFEGLTRMPDGRIIAAVQSTLDIDGKSKKQALFTRLVSFDPATGKTAMYGYPVDSAAYSKNSDAKIGDIVALDNHTILL
ncbi:esterase-like activity of phytase family protein, partial [Enterobacter hormaechei subsp. steigerwaltii]|nr:esterase-like activity of phytase family protein [Enterobacter hormaechei subsp. steigerwaltii]